MRPSRHPIVVRYCEGETIKQAMEEAADRSGSTFAEIQRRVNRAGLRALNIDPVRYDHPELRGGSHGELPAIDEAKKAARKDAREALFSTGEE